MDNKTISAVKRRQPLIYSYIDNENRNEYVSSLNRLIFYYRYFITKIDVKRCDVFKVRFDQSFGSELRGYHFVVAMQSSREINQTVTIIPLSSFKEAKQYNPKSTINIGTVEGIPGDKGTVALINQIRTIDKVRLIGEKALEYFVEQHCEQIDRVNGEFYIQNKEVYRLSEEQYKMILHAINNYLFVGSVERRNS